MPDVDTDLVKPSPYQPRLDFDVEDIRGSITRYGIRAPLTVRQRDNYYELIDGERRLRLAKELGYETVPIHVIDVDDEAARRLVWQMNILHKPYAPKETAFHLKKLQQDIGLGIRAIGRECGYSHTEVRAYLGIFQLPEKYQEYIWLRKIGVGDMIQLLPLLNGTGIRIPEVTNWLDQRLSGSLRSKEELGKAIRPTLKKLEEERVRKAQEAVGEIAPEITLETPEDYERAGKALKQKGERMRHEAMTPEELLEEEEEKQRKKRKKEEKKRQEELRLLEAETIETAKTKEEVERAKAKLRELIPEDKRTEVEEVLATSDLSLGVLEKLPDVIRREPDRPIIEIARELHLEATPGLKKPRVGQPKPEPDLTDWVNEVTKTGYSLMELLDKMMAGNFRQIAPKIEILRINEMLFALEIKIRKYREGQKGKGENDA